MVTGRVTTYRCIASESDLAWAVQDWLAEGRQEVRQDEAASMTLRLLVGHQHLSHTHRIWCLQLRPFRHQPS